MQQIKHMYKDYDIYIVWYDDNSPKLLPYAEMFICDRGLCVSDTSHYWKYCEKFDTDETRWGRYRHRISEGIR